MTTPDLAPCDLAIHDLTTHDLAMHNLTTHKLHNSMIHDLTTCNSMTRDLALTSRDTCVTKSCVERVVKSYIAILLMAIISLSYSNFAQAQRSVPKYDNVVKENAVKSPLAAFNSYLDYANLLQQSNQSDPSRPFLFFQIAQLANQLMDSNSTLDKEKNLSYFKQIADQYYRFCLTATSIEKDFKRDRDYFADVPAADKRPNSAEVKQYIDQELLKMDAKYQKIMAINKIEQSIQSNYWDCFLTYRQLSNETDMYSDLFTNWNQNSVLIRQMSQSYQAVVKGQEQMKLATPQAQFEIHSISTFRMDGLDRPDFTNWRAKEGARTLELWNYGAWADSCVVYYDREIASVMRRAKSADSTFDAQINQLKKKNITEATPFVLDRLLFPALLKVDNENTIGSLLLFKKSVVDFMTLLKSPLNTSSDPSMRTKNQLMNYLDKVTQSYQQLNENEKMARLAYQKKELNEGVIQTLSTSTQVLYDEAIGNIKKYCFDYSNQFRSSSVLEWKKSSIPFYLGQGFYRATTAQWITKAIISDDKGGYYLSGSSVNTQGFSVAFTAYSPDGITVSWVKTTDLFKMMYDDVGLALTLDGKGGCFVLISSKNVSDPSLMTQTVLQFDVKGEQLLNISLPEKTLPLGRFMIYRPQTQSLVLGFYGENEDWFESNGRLVIQEISLDNKQIMRADYPLNGSVVDIFPAGTGYILMGNYTSIAQSTSQEMEQTPSGSTGIYTIALSNQGVLSRLQTFKFDESVYLTHAAQTAKGKYVLLGQKGKSPKEPWFPYTAQGKTISMVVD